MSNEDKKKRFTYNLNYYVSMSGKQQKDIAKDIGVNHKTFNGWCRGITLPSIPKLDKLAGYFGIDRNDLLGDSTISLTEPEENLVRAYRAAPESRREAVRALLGIVEKGNVEQQQGA